MKKKTVYVVTAEVTAGSDSDFFRETGCEGAFMNALVAAGDALEAGRRVEKALKEDLFKGILVEEIILSDNYSFDGSDSDISFKDLKKEAEKTGEVIYGEFFLFEE